MGHSPGFHRTRKLVVDHREGPDIDFSKQEEQKTESCNTCCKNQKRTAANEPSLDGTNFFGYLHCFLSYAAAENFIAGTGISGSLVSTSGGAAGVTPDG